MESVIVWLRDDLRLHDNPAVTAACNSGKPVIFLYIDDPLRSVTTGAASRWFLHHVLQRLQKQLLTNGQQLILRQGDAVEIIDEISKHHSVATLFYNRNYSPHFIATEPLLSDRLGKAGINSRRFNGVLLHNPETVLTQSETPYRVFTPFWKKLQQQLGDTPPLPLPKFPTPTDGVKSLALEQLQLLPDHPWQQKLEVAWLTDGSDVNEILENFMDHTMSNYPTLRDRPEHRGTSHLSPHLHFGEISAREIAYRVKQHMAHHQEINLHKGAEAFLRQLGWREFAHYLLYHFPETITQPLDNRFVRFPWRKNYQKDLQRWQQGRTGYPIIDAGMRELWFTGWMHNRVRMIVASFLCKNLLIPWQEGARWFNETLVDADLANNTMGWQWVAGSGADAAPYFRIFNPITQSKRFDAKGEYISRWLPGLSSLPNKWIHTPWLAPGKEQITDYPYPMVDLTATREQALTAWKKIK